jgi:uncharacterized protein
VLGILLMNIPMMGLRWEWPRPPLPAGPTLDWIVLTIQEIGFAGTMRGLFTVLFGAGMILMLRRPDPGLESAARQAYYTRCFALMLLGVANFAIFIWPGEILFCYGVCGLVLPLFRKAPTRMLLAAAAAILLVMTVGVSAPALKNAQTLRLADAAVAARTAGKPVTEEQKKALEKRDERIKKMNSPELRAKERETRTHLPTLLLWSVERWAEFNLDLNQGAHLALLESLGFMLLGMALFQSGVLTGERSMSTYWALLVVGVVLGLALRGGVMALRWRAGFLPNADVATFASLTYEAGRLAMTLGWLGGLMLLIKGRLLGPLGGVLAAVGRTALTNYVLQSIVTSILFYGFGLYDRLGFAQLMEVCVAIWVGQAILSVLWLRVYDMGPAEWLLRSLTYGAWRSIRRSGAAPAVAAE